MVMIITHHQSKQLLEAKKNGLKNLEISLDLNKTKANVRIEQNYFIFPDNQKLEESQLKKPIKDNSRSALR